MTRSLLLFNVITRLRPPCYIGPLLTTQISIVASAVYCRQWTDQGKYYSRCDHVAYTMVPLAV